MHYTAEPSGGARLHSRRSIHDLPVDVVERIVSCLPSGTLKVLRLSSPQLEQIARRQLFRAVVMSRRIHDLENFEHICTTPRIAACVHDVVWRSVCEAVLNRGFEYLTWADILIGFNHRTEIPEEVQEMLSILQDSGIDRTWGTRMVEEQMVVRLTEAARLRVAALRTSVIGAFHQYQTEMVLLMHGRDDVDEFGVVQGWEWEKPWLRNQPATRTERLMMQVLALNDPDVHPVRVEDLRIMQGYPLWTDPVPNFRLPMMNAKLRREFLRNLQTKAGWIEQWVRRLPNVRRILLDSFCAPILSHHADGLSPALPQNVPPPAGMYRHADEEGDVHYNGFISLHERSAMSVFLKCFDRNPAGVPRLCQVNYVICGATVGDAAYSHERNIAALEERPMMLIRENGRYYLPRSILQGFGRPLQDTLIKWYWTTPRNIRDSQGRVVRNYSRFLTTLSVNLTRGNTESESSVAKVYLSDYTLRYHIPAAIDYRKTRARVRLEKMVLYNMYFSDDALLDLLSHPRHLGYDYDGPAATDDEGDAHEEDEVDEGDTAGENPHSLLEEETDLSATPPSFPPRLLSHLRCLALINCKTTAEAVRRILGVESSNTICIDGHARISTLGVVDYSNSANVRGLYRLWRQRMPARDYTQAMNERLQGAPLVYFMYHEHEYYIQYLWFPAPEDGPAEDQ